MPFRSERRRSDRFLLERIDRRNWHLWLLSFCVTFCLALAIAAFFYPALRWGVDRFEILYGIFPQLILGLLIMVFLCIIYIIIKQRELNELRNFLIATHLEARQLIADLPHDPLTGVLDRRTLPDVLKREVTWVDRYRVPLSLVLSNVVGFQQFNVEQGNLAGDEILKVLANLFGATARQTDTILRYGPDRFLCFLPRTDAVGARAFARRVSEACQRSPRLRDISLVFGITEYRPGSSADKILADVESNLRDTARPVTSRTAPSTATRTA